MVSKRLYNLHKAIDFIAIMGALLTSFLAYSVGKRLMGHIQAR